jgi:DNA-directed RNA polymerase subunit RPC12/RpoP
MERRKKQMPEEYDAGEELIFRCPSCGHETLEEVVVGTVLVSPIHSVKDEDIVYGDPKTYGGEVEEYRCEYCGYELKTKEGYNVRRYDDLLDWLRNQPIPDE